MGDFGNGQAFDVASSPGEWRECAVFAALHTQNPGAAMDDRFDMMFATGELFDGTGLEYVADSYRVFGNDGSHTFNGAITSGTGAPSNILPALTNASDHLPIVGPLYVGLSDAGTLEVEASGVVSDVYGYIGYHSDSTGIATVAGTDSRWNTTFSLRVGHNGAGTLNVESGGVVSNQDGKSLSGGPIS